MEYRIPIGIFPLGFGVLDKNYYVIYPENGIMGGASILNHGTYLSLPTNI